MYLKQLSLVNFKNYDQVDLEFSSKINCFVGKNGAGKTNLLDAIFYLSFCKSFFTNIDSQNIRHDQDFFVIQGDYDLDGGNEAIYCGMKRNQKKQFKRNKKDYQKLSDHIGLLPLVMVSPADISLIVEGSDERRKYMNFVISQFDKQYLNNIITYNRALKQRNTLLKQFAKTNSFDGDSLAIWTEQLIRYGNDIYNARVKFINELLPVFQENYNFISDGNEQVDLIYNSQLHEKSLKELFAKSIEKDRVLQYSTVGIHKDDLELLLGKYPIKRIGSQGQKKTYLMSLKMAQFEFIKEINGFKPVILLDDIFDKFDAERVSQIIKMVGAERFGQIFITDTSQDRLETILSDTKVEYKIFNTEKGAIV